MVLVRYSGRLAVSALTGLGLIGAAAAADLPSRREPAPYVAPLPVFTWTGFYVGANAGYGFSASSARSVSFPAGTFAAAPAATGTLAALGGRDRSGFVGGGQAGYNYQIGSVVLGVEADLQYADLGRRSATGYTFAGTGSVPASFTFVSPRNAVDWFGTVRGRVGYAFDKLLVYGTGGFAYGGGANGYCYSGTCDTTRVGYAAGAGLEYALTPNWTAKVEGLYVNLGRDRSSVYGYDTGGTVYSTTATRGDADFGLVRAGVNYKF